MKMLATVIGIIGVICMIISLITAIASVSWVATANGWLDLALTFFVLSIALVVVKPFSPGEQG